MRKIFAVLLAALMLVSVVAAFPVSAATYDNSTATTPNMNKFIITEIAADAVTTAYKKSGKMNYIEIYNNSGATKNVYELALTLAPDYSSKPNEEKMLEDVYAPKWNLWRNEYKFLTKQSLKPGVIWSAEDKAADAISASIGTLTDLQMSNPDTMTFDDGEVVVVWFIQAETLELLNAVKDNTTGFNALKYFKQVNNLPDDAKVVMAWAYSNVYVYGMKLGEITTDSFPLPKVSFSVSESNNMSFMYGVVESTFDVSEAVVDGSNWNSKVYSLAPYGFQNEKTFQKTAQNKAAVYAFASAVPAVYNAFEKQLNPNNTGYTDYVVADISDSYREAGMIQCDAAMTPGTLPDWQWAMIAPTHAKAPASIKGEGAAEAVITAYALTVYPDLSDDDIEDERQEIEDIVPQPPTREELLEQFYGEGAVSDDNRGGVTVTYVREPIWPLIIGLPLGGVAIVAVVVVLIVSSKKKKAQVDYSEMPEADEDAEA